MKPTIRSSVVVVLAALGVGGTAVAQDISAEAVDQMKAVASAKASLTPAQRKLGSGLAFGILAASNDGRVAAFTNAITPLSGTDLAGVPQSTATTGVVPTVVAVDIYGTVTDGLANAITAAGGKIVYNGAKWGVVRASVPVAALTDLAGRSDVRQIRSPAAIRTHVGSVTSQGYVTHAASTVVASGVTGAGVTVGVLSDSASPARIAALIASGDLPPDTQVLPGQEGDGEDEGAAMMEIVHDMAPGAKLKFATAFNGEASFADNIIALANAGAKVIVDDVSYSDEGAFQDGPIQLAVNQVTAMGVTYFSAAGNDGSVTKGTGSSWEGDFKSGGAATGVLAGTGLVHNFAATGTQNFDVLTVAAQIVTIRWSDPLGKSANDYDLFVLNAAGTRVIAVGGDTQDGSQDPYEEALINGGNTLIPANSRIVVVKYLGDTRALHVDTFGAGLSLYTTGATVGHNAGATTMSTAATYWNSGKMGSRPFTGFANTNETFSSDGPRKMFFNADGTQINGSVLFATNGGITLQKPDIAAADGVTTHTPGFLPFFGTSAAAPHAAGIAALILAARPDYTPDQVKAAIRNSALDSMTVGVDRDSGYGVAMANAAVQYAKTH